MLHKAEPRQSKRPHRARDLPTVTAVHWQGALHHAMCVCIYSCVCVLGIPKLSQTPSLSFLSKSAPKNSGKDPFPASEDAGTLRHTTDRASRWLFMTRCSGRLPHTFIHVVMGGKDKPNHSICVPLDSKNEKMIQLGFTLHNGVTFNQTGTAEPSARAVIINATSS